MMQYVIILYCSSHCFWNSGIMCSEPGSPTLPFARFVGFTDITTVSEFLHLVFLKKKIPSFFVFFEDFFFLVSLFVSFFLVFLFFLRIFFPSLLVHEDPLVLCRCVLFICQVPNFICYQLLISVSLVINSWLTRGLSYQ